MEKREGNDWRDGRSLPQPSTSDLRGRQSVRATFRLSEKAIDAISIVSLHLGIKQKSLFDHLLDDIESLKLVAREIQDEEFNLPNRIQKTYVVSRRTLSCLDTASKTLNTPRDALVEYSIQRLLPLIAKERERHRKREAILEELTQYLILGKKLLAKSKELLGKDDPVSDRFGSALTVLSSAHSTIASFVEKGKVIEDF